MSAEDEEYEEDELISCLYAGLLVAAAHSPQYRQQHTAARTRTM